MLLGSRIDSITWCELCAITIEAIRTGNVDSFPTDAINRENHGHKYIFGAVDRVNAVMY